MRLVILAVVAVCLPAQGAVLIESGNFTGGDVGSAQSANINQFMGWRFTLPTDMTITSLGGALYMSTVAGPIYGSTIFGAIVPVASLVSFPDSPTTFTPVVTALLTPPVGYTAGSLTSAPVNVNLTAGTYALIFGSGRFGADSGGQGALRNIGSAPSPSNTMLVGNVGLDTWTSAHIPDYYFVTAEPTPEPTTWLTGVLLGSLFVASRLRQSTKVSGIRNVQS